MLSKILIGLGCVVFGGAIGYYIGGAVARRLAEEEYIEYPEENDWVPASERIIDSDAIEELAKSTFENAPKPDFTAYSRQSKEELAKLASKYSSDLTRTSHVPQFEVITDEQYSEDHGYRKLAVDYYQGDNAFVNDQGILIPYPDSMFGKQASLKFGQNNPDPDVVYIRDMVLKADYEITRLVGDSGLSFIAEEPEEPDETKKRSRRKGRSKDEAEE